MGYGQDFFPLLRSLREQNKGLRFVAPDLPGHAGSPLLSAPHSLDALADWLLPFLPPSSSAPSPLLIGYSLGGRIALHAAIRFPHRFSGLILLSASPGISDPSEAARRASADIDTAATLRRIPPPPQGTPAFQAFLESWWAQPLFASPRWTPAFYRSYLHSHPDRLAANPADLACILEEASPGKQAPLWNALSSLSLPSLFLTGECDAKFCAIAQQMTQKCRAASWQKIPASGHSLLLENPPELATVISSWIKTNTPFTCET